MKTFGTRLRHAMRHFGPLCVGIDPHPQLLEAWGLTDDIDGLEAFAETCVEAFDGRVALVKPQVAFFEAYGSGASRCWSARSVCCALPEHWCSPTPSVVISAPPWMPMPVPGSATARSARTR